MTYQPKVYREQGGEKLSVASGGSISVASGGEITMASGGKITAAGTQAVHIANPAGGATNDAEARTAINSILTALENVGILASS